MIVIFDTNIWKGNLWLRSGAAASVRLFLAKKSAKVAMPQVLRQEIERHLSQDLKKHREAIRDGHTRLLAAFDKLSAIELPTDRDIDTLSASLIENTGLDVVDIPLSLEAATDSYLRTIDKTPPSRSSQEFKDGIIWYECKKLCESDDVVLVTADKAFYEGGSYDKGLADKLKAELVNVVHRFRIFPSLMLLLADIREPLTVDDNLVDDAIEEFFGDNVTDVLEKTRFARGPTRKIEMESYATETPDELYVEFFWEGDCEDTSDQNRQGLLRIDGTGHFDIKKNKFVSLQPQKISVFRVDGEVEVEEHGHVFLYAEGFSLGRQFVKHNVKEKIE
jgi:hypothetical protein